MLEGFKVVSIWKNKAMPDFIIQVHKLIGVRAELNLVSAGAPEIFRWLER